MTGPRVARRTRTLLGALFVVLAVVASACGSDDEQVTASGGDADTSSTDASSTDDSSTDGDMGDMDHEDGEREGDEHDHDHDDTQMLGVNADGAPTVSFTAEQNSDGMVVLSIETSNFSFANTAEEAETIYAGHAHVTVDGELASMLFSDSYVLELPPGDSLVAAVLQSVDHIPYALGGDPIAYSAVIHVPENGDDVFTVTPVDGDLEVADGDAGDHDHDHDHSDAEVVEDGDLATADEVVEIHVHEGEVTTDVGRVEVDTGTVLGISVHADVADEVHVHGYDLLAPVEPDRPGVIVFDASIPGVWEIELENAGLLLFELEVS